MAAGDAAPGVEDRDHRPSREVLGGVAHLLHPRAVTERPQASPGRTSGGCAADRASASSGRSSGPQEAPCKTTVFSIGHLLDGVTRAPPCRYRCPSGHRRASGRPATAASSSRARCRHRPRGRTGSRLTYRCVKMPAASPYRVSIRQLDGMVDVARRADRDRRAEELVLAQRAPGVHVGNDRRGQHRAVRSPPVTTWAPLSDPSRSAASTRIASRSEISEPSVGIGLRRDRRP